MNKGIENSSFRQFFAAVAVALFPALAHAHAVPGQSSGLAAGLTHPFTGLEHLLAMVAVGLWAAQRGGRALWIAPLTFVSVMTLGGALGMAGLSLPFIQGGIILSVLVLGVLIAAAVRLPMFASVAVLALFALFHGHAHGNEMAQSASGMIYALGFVVSTAALHVTGIALGLAARQSGQGLAVRYAGGAIAVCGLALCFL
jgi:urease accessory protein